jgi:anti-sigma regulatory factor (Ser/Thr protein kinase)
VEHATGPTEDWIRLDLDIDSTRLRLGLEDESTPFDPRLAPAPNLDFPLEERSSRGMGLHVVREMVDGMHYRRLADRNRLEVEIALQRKADAIVRNAGPARGLPGWPHRR